MKSWKKRVSAVLLAAMVVSMLSVSAFAAEGGTTGNTATIISAFQSGFQSMVSDALSMIAVIVPIAVSLAGVIWLVRKAMSWFKSMAK